MNQYGVGNVRGKLVDTEQVAAYLKDYLADVWKRAQHARDYQQQDAVDYYLRLYNDVDEIRGHIMGLSQDLSQLHPGQVTETGQSQ